MPINPAEMVRMYCEMITTDCSFGGELELHALAHLLQQKICVYQEEAKEDENQSEEKIKVAQLRNFFPRIAKSVLLGALEKSKGDLEEAANELFMKMAELADADDEDQVRFISIWNTFPDSF